MSTKVPAEPIRQVIENWLRENEAEIVRQELFIHGEGHEDYVAPFSPLQRIVFAIWGKDVPKKSGHYRTISRLLDRRPGHRIRTSPSRKAWRELYCQREVSFELADQILCGLNMTHLWQNDPLLSVAYLEVDLAKIDQLKPVTS